MFNWKIIFHIGIPIFLGACIYTFFRVDSLLIFYIYELFQIDGLINVIRYDTMTWKIPDFIKYSLPDGLWVYAFTNYMVSIWKNENPSWMKFIFLSSPFLFGIGGELIQIIAPSIGTFDMGDLIISVAAFSIAYMIVKPVKINQEMSERYV